QRAKAGRLAGALDRAPRRIVPLAPERPGGDLRRTKEFGMAFSDATRAKLAAVSTATLTTVLMKRGLRNTFISDLTLINSKAPRMVGPAYTLRYIPAREDLDHLKVFEDRSHPQRRAVEECPPGHVMVIDSRKDHRAASAGGILVSRLMKRGIAG